MLDYFELAKSLARREGERVMGKANEPAYPVSINYPGFTEREAYALAAMKSLIATFWLKPRPGGDPGNV